MAFEHDLTAPDGTEFTMLSETDNPTDEEKSAGFDRWKKEKSLNAELNTLSDEIIKNKQLRSNANPDFTEDELRSVHSALTSLDVGKTPLMFPSDVGEDGDPGDELLAVRVALGITPATAPISPFTEFAGGYLQSTLKDVEEGRDIDHLSGLRSGAFASGLDVGARLLTGGFSGAAPIKAGVLIAKKGVKTGFQTLTKKGLTVLEEPAARGQLKEFLAKLPKPIDKRIAQWIIRGTLKDKGLSDEAVDFAFAHPEYLKLTRGKLETVAGRKIATKAGEATRAASIVRSKHDELGKVIKGIKDSIGKEEANIAINSLKPGVIDALSSGRRAARITGKGIIKSTGKEGISAFNDIDDAVVPLLSKRSQTYDSVTQVVKNIDDSQSFRQLYKVMSDDGFDALSPGQKLALGTRNKIKSLIDDNIADEALRLGLITSKKAYTEFRRLIDLPAFRNKITTSEGVQTIISKAMGPKGGRDMGNLKALSNMVVGNENLFINSFGHEVVERVGPGAASGLFDVARALITTPLAKGIITPGLAGATVKRAARQAVVRTGTAIQQESLENKKKLTLQSIKGRHALKGGK